MYLYFFALTLEIVIRKDTMNNIKKIFYVKGVQLVMNEAINYYLSAVAMFEDEVEDSSRNLHSH